MNSIVYLCFLRGDIDQSQLLAMIEGEIDYAWPCGHDYPYIHRILDLQAGSTWIRMIRCQRCCERLTFMRISEASGSNRVGVPFELTGHRLRAWVDAEAIEQADEDRDLPSPYAVMDWSPWLGTDELDEQDE